MEQNEANRFAFPDFRRAFCNDERFGDFESRVVEASKIVLPTGRIVACEPINVLMEEQPAFTRVCSPGCYPVLLSLLVSPDYPHLDGRVACAAVRFLDSPIAEWEMALRPGWELSELDPGCHFGYGVDGGRGAFLDEIAVKSLAAQRKGYLAAFDELARSGKLNWEKMLAIMPPSFQALFLPKQATDPNHPARSSTLDPETGANIVSFPTGIGDGYYASYFGLTEDGSVATLVTDFGLLVKSITEEIELSVPVQESSELRHPDLALAGLECIRVEWDRTKNKLTIHAKETPYLEVVSFENRPDPVDSETVDGVYHRQGDEQWYYLKETLQPTARIFVQYTRGTQAL